MLTNICKKPESSLSFSYKHTVTKGTNLTPLKTVTRWTCSCISANW